MGDTITNSTNSADATSDPRGSEEIRVQDICDSILKENITKERNEYLEKLKNMEVEVHTYAKRNGELPPARLKLKSGYEKRKLKLDKWNCRSLFKLEDCVWYVEWEKELKLKSKRVFDRIEKMTQVHLKVARFMDESKEKLASLTTAEDLGIVSVAEAPLTVNEPEDLGLPMCTSTPTISEDEFMGQYTSDSNSDSSKDHQSNTIPRVTEKVVAGNLRRSPAQEMKEKMDVEDKVLTFEAVKYISEAFDCISIDGKGTSVAELCPPPNDSSDVKLSQGMEDSFDSMETYGGKNDLTAPIDRDEGFESYPDKWTLFNEDMPDGIVSFAVETNSEKKVEPSGYVSDMSDGYVGPSTKPKRRRRKRNRGFKKMSGLCYSDLLASRDAYMRVKNPIYEKIALEDKLSEQSLIYERCVSRDLRPEERLSLSAAPSIEWNLSGRQDLVAPSWDFVEAAIKRSN